jgi:exopolysaccharide biosynthesis polyprenyl glycosylphosphotransferase
VLPFLTVDAIAALAASAVVLVLFGRPTVLAALPSAWILSLHMQGAYQEYFLRAATDEFGRVLRGAGLLTVAAGLTWWFGASAGFLHDALLALAITTAVTLPLRRLWRRHLRAKWHSGHNVQRALVIGPGRAAAELNYALQRQNACELKVVHAFLTDRELDGDGDTARTVRAVIDTVRRSSCDAVIALPSPELCDSTLRRLSWELDAEGVELRLAPVLTDVAANRLAMTQVGGLPLVEMRGPAVSRLRRIPKELTDRLLAALALVVLSPLMLAIALLVRVDSPGPALFAQRRIGLHGQEFTLLKFRTMCKDAESRRAELASLNRYGDHRLFKVVDDPRITRIGAFLRHYSLDELPQLLNVVAGRMSLVGPRPLLADESLAWDGEIRRRRLLVKPGLSGLWQVSGRSDLSVEDRVRMDLDYVENWSFALDLAILARTPSAVIHGTGAH